MSSERVVSGNRGIRADVWNACGGKCHHCGCVLEPFANFQVDHLVPLVLGGKDERDNLVGSCTQCNRERGYEARRKARELARTPAIVPVLMTPEELRERRARMKLSQEELARRLSATRQSVYMWERGDTKPPGMLDLALRYLEMEARGVKYDEVMRDAQAE